MEDVLKKTKFNTLREHFTPTLLPFSSKAIMDAENSKVQQWEKLMWTFQKGLPNTKKGTKWVLMDRIYNLNK